jgi:hypothetical protein
MPDEIFTPLSSLAETGILGLVLTISIIGNVVLLRTILGIQEKRVSESKDLADKVLEPVRALQKSVDAIMPILQLILTVIQNQHKGSK